MENGEASTQALGLSPMLAQLQKELSEAQSTGYTLGRQMSLICRELPPLPAQLSPFAEDSAQQSVRANLNTQHSLATTLKLEWQHSEDSSMDRCVSMDQVETVSTHLFARTPRSCEPVPHLAMVGLVGTWHT